MNDLDLEIKNLIITSLNLEEITPEDIASSEPLFIDGLGLDSIDALELGMAIQKKYGIKSDSKNDKIKEYFYSVETLSKFINENK